MSVWSNIKGFFAGGDVPNIPSNQGIQFFEYNGVTQWTDVCGSESLRAIYQKCAPLSSIISNKADVFATGEIEVLNAKTLNYTRGQYKEWDKLLMRPNPIQNQTQFLKQIYTYCQLRGWCFVLKDYAVGFPNIPYQMWVLPSWYIDIDCRNINIYNLDREKLLSGIYFNYGGRRVPLDPKSLMLITDSTDLLDDKTWLPDSRVTLLQYPITTLLSSVEAEITMIQKRGAIGILSNDTHDGIGSIAMMPGEKEKLESNFQNKYGLTRAQAQIIITDSAVKWQSMTFPTKELLLHESYIKAYKDIAEKYNYPFTLTAHSQNSTYNNIQSDDRRLYQSTIIPEAKSIMQQLNEGLNTEKDNVLITIDYSKVPALQQSEKEKGEGQKSLNEALKIEWENGLITRNDWLVAIGKDKVNKPEFNMYIWELNVQQQQTVVTPNIDEDGSSNA